jgi:hypothetical protein
VNRNASCSPRGPRSNISPGLRECGQPGRISNLGCGVFRGRPGFSCFQASRRACSLKAAAVPELRRIWSQLTPEEQDYIDRSMALANGLYETVKILSRLAECLQQRIVELEAGVVPVLEDRRG